MDGVLVHSMPLHTLAWERYLAGLGITVENLEQRMHGKRNSELVRDLISADLPEDVIFHHGAEKERLFREMMIEDGLRQYAIPGVSEFLARHKDVPKAVASNAEPQNIDFVLDRFQLREYFPVTVNGMQVARPKPFPDVFLEAARRLDTPAAALHCLRRLAHRCDCRCCGRDARGGSGDHSHHVPGNSAQNQRLLRSGPRRLAGNAKSVEDVNATE